MNHLKRYTIYGIIFTFITGTLLHFTYEWSGNNHIVGYLSAVNESIWEHMKLVFFPMLFYSFYMNHKLKNEYSCVTSSLLFGILLGTLLIPVIFYVYSGILGRNLLILDISTFIICVLISFSAVYKLSSSCLLKNYPVLLKFLVFLSAVCFLVFTYNHPEFGIFADPAK